MKRPDVMILNEATSSLDAAVQTSLLQGLREEMKGRGLVWAVHRASMAEDFDRVMVMKSGRVVEQGSFDELDKDGSELRAMVEAE